MHKFFKMIALAGMLGTGSFGHPRFRAPVTVPATVRMIGGGSDPLAEVLGKATVKELRTMATAMKIAGRSKARRKTDLVKLIAGATLVDPS